MWSQGTSAWAAPIYVGCSSEALLSSDLGCGWETVTQCWPWTIRVEGALVTWVMRLVCLAGKGARLLPGQPLASFDQWSDVAWGLLAPVPCLPIKEWPQVCAPLFWESLASGCFREKERYCWSPGSESSAFQFYMLCWAADNPPGASDSDNLERVLPWRQLRGKSSKDSPAGDLE